MRRHVRCCILLLFPAFTQASVPWYLEKCGSNSGKAAPTVRSCLTCMWTWEYFRSQDTFARSIDGETFCEKLVEPYFESFPDVDLDLFDVISKKLSTPCSVGCKGTFTFIDEIKNSARWLSEMRACLPSSDLLPFEVTPYYLKAKASFTAFQPLQLSSRELCIYSDHCRNWIGDKVGNRGIARNNLISLHFSRFKLLHFTQG